jgi:serine/threonine protein kinase
MLGRGGMGAVYKALQTSLDRLVAIKILSGSLQEKEESGFTLRFKNEARAMAKLNHPGIVSVYDFGETPSGLLYIVMEFVDGTDVSKMIASSGRLRSEHAMAITAHVCDALAYAHERGIIHRDIKPANIMVDYEGRVKVADFGLAKVTSSQAQSGLTHSNVIMGTLHYMAPESLILGTELDQRADIYAVGVMLYQMLTGKLPQGLFEMPSLRVPGLDPRYDKIVASALREDRELRYPSAGALRLDLDAILTQPVVKVEAAATEAPPGPQHTGEAETRSRPALPPAAAGCSGPAPEKIPFGLVAGAGWVGAHPRAGRSLLAFSGPEAVELIRNCRLNTPAPSRHAGHGAGRRRQALPRCRQQGHRAAGQRWPLPGGCQRTAGDGLHPASWAEHRRAASQPCAHLRSVIGHGRGNGNALVRGMS